jgi:hypothetical protein
MLAPVLRQEDFEKALRFLIESRKTASYTTPSNHSSAFEGVVQMSEEQSVSRVAEARRGKDHEAGRKATSKIKSFKPKPSDSFTRADQHATVVGLNVGSNRNNPERVVSNREKVGNIVVEAHGVTNPDFTPDQTERSHSDVDSGSKAGGHKSREVKESVAAERHVQGEPGFVEAGRRSAAVQSRRRETEKVFDSHRKKYSSV